jgi:hypothetical protein
LAEHRSLEEPQLLGGLRQLLLVCGDGFLLLRDDSLLFRVCLLLRMPVDESYPGIQLTTARKAGDSLTLTL